MPERFEIYIVYKRRYINTLPFLFSFISRSRTIGAPDLRLLRCSGVGGGGCCGNQWSGAGVADVDITVVMFITQAPDDRSPSPVVRPASYPIFTAVSVRSPRHARPEGVVDTTQVHLCTPAYDTMLFGTHCLMLVERQNLSVLLGVD